MRESIPDCLPWHGALMTELLAQRARDALHPVLLLSAPEHAGKHRFAGKLAAALLCEKAQQHAGDRLLTNCGECRSCGLVQAGTHPDLYSIGRSEEGKSIGVDAIRALVETLQLSAQIAGAKVALIGPCEALTENASNALLKALEEPADNVFFLLMANSRRSVLPTVASRSQRIALSLPTRDELAKWLSAQQAGANPNAAIDAARGYPELALSLLQSDESSTLQPLASQLLAGEIVAAELVSKVDAADLAQFCDTLLLLLLARLRSETIVDGNAPAAKRLAAGLQVVTDVRQRLRYSPNSKLLLESLALRLHGAV